MVLRLRGYAGLNGQIEDFVLSQNKPSTMGPDHIELWVTYNNSLAETENTIRLAAQYGYNVVPGLRYFTGALTDEDWVNRDHWEERAIATRSMAFLRTCDPRTGRAEDRMYMDMESYVDSFQEPSSTFLEGIGATEEDLLDAMLPFRQVIEELRIRPCVGPASGDHLAMRAAIRAAGNRGELISEDTYSDPYKYVQEKYAYGERLRDWLSDREETLAPFGGGSVDGQIKVIPAYRDYLLRSSGTSFRSTLYVRYSNYDERGIGDGWFFLRDRTYENIWGSSFWVSCASLSTLNNGIGYVFRWTSGGPDADLISSATMQQMARAVGGSEVAASTLDLGWGDETNYGLRFDRRRYLRWDSQQNGLSTASPFFFDLEFWFDQYTSDAGLNLPLVGFTRTNNRAGAQFYLYYDVTSTKMVLETRRTNNTTVTATSTSSPTPQMWNRVRVEMSPNTAVLVFGGNSHYASSATVIKTGEISMYVGAGFAGYSSTATPIFAHNVMIRNFNIWNRAIAAGENPATDGVGQWPFGHDSA